MIFVQGAYMKKWIFTAIAALCLSSSFAYAQTEEKLDVETRVMARIKLASEYYYNNQVASALRELETAKSINDSYAPLHNMMGIVNMDLRQFPEADASFQKALRLEPNNPDIHNNYGWFLCVSGQYSKGIDWLIKAGSNPRYTTPEKAWYNAGRCSKMASDITKAGDYFAKALSLSPKSTAVMYELALLRFEQQQYSAVLEIIERIHEVENTTPQSLWLAIKTENRLNHRNEMESYGQKLLKKYPTSAEAALWTTRSFN